MFHPRREPPQLAWPSGVRPVQAPVETDVTVGGRFYPAGSDAPALLYFHGNGEIAADYDGIAPLYTRMGIALLVMDYRGYGQSTGTPTAANLQSDAVLIANQIESMLGRAPDRLFVMGRSLGSAAAVQVALETKVGLAGLIIESGFAHTFALLARMGVFLPQADEQRDGFANLEKIGRVAVRTLIIHGEADVLIPVEDGRALYRWSGAADKKLVVVPRGGHNDLMMVGRPQYFEASQSFVFRSAAAGGQVLAH